MNMFEKRAGCEVSDSEGSKDVRVGGVVPRLLQGIAGVEVQAAADLGLSFLDNPCTDNVDAAYDERQADAAADYERNRSSFVHAAVDLYGTDELRIPPEPDPSHYDMADPGQRSRLAADRRAWLNRAEAAVNGHYRANTHDTDWSIRKTVNDLNSGRRVG